MSQPSPLAAAQHHAQALAATGDLTGAELTLQYALEGGRASLGEDDPAVLAIAHQLATVYRQSGDPSASRRVLEEAFAAGRWRLGDADPLMLSISFDLGVVAEELGNRHEARKAFGRVAEVGPPVLGDDHWAVRRAQTYLGETGDTAPGDTAEGTVAEAVPEAEGPAAQAAPSTVPEQGAGYDESVPEPPPFRETVPPAYQQVGAEVVSRPASTPQVVAPATVALTPAHFSDRGEFDRGGLDRGGLDRGERTRGRGPVIFAAVAAAIAALAAVAALVLVLVVPTRDKPAQRPSEALAPGAPTLSNGRAPGDVRLRDVGSTVELSWTDPSTGSVSFLVTGGHAGELLKPMGQIGPGRTTLRLQGLNSGLDYCFAVVAVYSISEFSSSPQVCTDRSGASPDPTPTR